MILTKNKALMLVSDIELVKTIKEFVPVYQAYQQKEIEFTKKKNCKRCERIDFFGDVSKMAINALLSLSEESIKVLKGKLNTTQPIYVYISDEAGVRMREIKTPTQ